MFVRQETALNGNCVFGDARRIAHGIVFRVKKRFKMAERWLRCHVRKGMFSDEMVVVIKILSGETASFFVPREWVSGDENREGQVKVRTFMENSHAWAIVPNESQTVVAVDASQLIA
ncbi:MAG TPA: hypothetical protein VFE47_12880 [Tepidisphaeraceae bacterium]|jgi:hypothetical protein|nr:hypothetical protein [Tepidisphaeraceae bacterium]